VHYVDLPSYKSEYILRILQTKKIPYTSYDLASDDDAKRLWRRKAPPGMFRSHPVLILRSQRLADDSADKQQLPGILVGGRFIGVCPYPCLPNTYVQYSW
jgi:hypothetical protein